jgi:hypothetical protein
MTMARQYPPHPPSQLPSTLGPYNNIAPAPSHASFLHNAANLEDRNLTQHSIPQQYAHPLSRHNSYGSESGRTPKPAEHMLRRKTPNGILAAAYDGTSVEQNGQPHATKHILLPVTVDSNIAYGTKQDLPLRSPGATNDPSQARQDASTEWSPKRYFETGSGLTGQHLPQIDSMLNQVPPLHPLLPYQMYGHPFCGPMGPPFQTPLGPTVSNDHGPFGPYWHDGTYIPYRPAAMRDPRFMHHSQNWSHTHNNDFIGYPYNNATPNMSQYQQDLLHLDRVQGAYNNNMGRPLLDFSPYAQQQPNFAFDYHNQSLPAQRPQDFLHSGQSTPVAEHIQITPLDEYGPQSPNGQNREKVFAWAHAVYVDLLRYLQSTRKSHSHHAHGRTHHRPHIYPKPPRQPGATFSNNTASTNPALERRVSYPVPSHYLSSQSGADFIPRRPPLPHSRSVSAWTMGGSDVNRQPWQDSLPQQPMLPQVPGMEPARTLRRMSGSVASAHQNARQGVPPSMTAASALEAITKHCEESKWSWIDGILLGGCLAYALGDYQKAQEWYKHILTLDRE